MRKTVLRLNKIDSGDDGLLYVVDNEVHKIMICFSKKNEHMSLFTGRQDRE